MDLAKRLGELSSTHYNPTEYFQWLGDLDKECRDRLGRVTTLKGMISVVESALREMRTVNPSSACKPTHEMYWDALLRYKGVLELDHLTPQAQQAMLVMHQETFKGEHDTEVARLAPSLAMLLRRAQLT